MKIFAMGRRHSGLYFLDTSASFASSTTLYGAHFDLWHWRLGHPVPSLFFRLKTLDSKISFNNQCTCTICPLAKHSRLPFPSSIISTTTCFELIHMDVWGPYKTPSLAGAKYFLTVVDDFSRLKGFF